MKRFLVFPAAASAALFTLLMVSIAQSTEREHQSRSSLTASSSKPKRTFDRATPAHIHRQAMETSVSALGRKAADALIEEQLLHPWRLASISPRHLFSRVRPTPPTVEAEIHIAEQSNAYFLGLASLSADAKEEAHQVPFVVDRQTKQLLVLADGRWQDHQQWIEKLPSDQRTNVDQLGYFQSRQR